MGDYARALGDRCAWVSRAVPLDPLLGVERSNAAAYGRERLDLPDNVSGVHLFRNGVTEAFARDVGLHAVVGRAAPACTFRWTGDGFAVSGSTLGVDTPGTSRSLAVRLDQIPRPR